MKTFLLPDLGEGLPDAEITQWHVKVGDQVKVDQPLVSMETAKALVELPSPFEGTVSKLFGKEGDIIITGKELVGYDDQQSGETREDTGTVVGEIESTGQTVDEATTVTSASGQAVHGVRITPAVRALAKKMNVDLNIVKPSGPNGLVTADDIKKVHDQLSEAGDLEKLRGVRRNMAITMVKSHQEVVPVTLSDDADIHDWYQQGDITVRMIQAIVAACDAEGALNAWYDGQAIGRRLHQKVHLGLAVDTSEGLFVPVIKDANTKDADALREDINDLKQGAHDRTLAPESFQGGTITLSNFGKFAGRYANPIIVPPTVAIIAIGKCRDSVVVHKGEPTIRYIAPVSLTFDHRAVTGGEASRFLAAFINALEG